MFSKALEKNYTKTAKTGANFQCQLKCFKFKQLIQMFAIVTDISSSCSSKKIKLLFSTFYTDRHLKWLASGKNSLRLQAVIFYKYHALPESNYYTF